MRYIGLETSNSVILSRIWTHENLRVKVEFRVRLQQLVVMSEMWIRQGLLVPLNATGGYLSVNSTINMALFYNQSGRFQGLVFIKKRL